MFRAFNKTAQILSDVCKEVMVLMCFIMMSVAEGKKRTHLQLAKPGESRSLWVPHSLPAKNIGEGPEDHLAHLTLQGSWISNFVRWSVKSRQWWMLSMVPYMLVISILSKEQQTTAVPTNVYTLY